MPRDTVFLVTRSSKGVGLQGVIFGVYVSRDAARYAVDQYVKHNFDRAVTWVDHYAGTGYGVDEWGTWSILKQEVKGKARVEAPTEETVARTYEWVMSPFERTALASWLSAYDGYSILLDTALSTPRLSDFGVTWDAAQRRLKYGARSVEVPTHSRAHFVVELQKARGRGKILDGVWYGVWMIDVACALLSLAGVEHDPTAGLTPRSLRYKTIINILKGEGDSRDAEDIVGEIRG